MPLCFCPPFFLLIGIPVRLKDSYIYFKTQCNHLLCGEAFLALPFPPMPCPALSSFILFQKNWLFSSQCHPCTLYITSIVAFITPLHYYFFTQLSAISFINLLEGNGRLLYFFKVYSNLCLAHNRHSQNMCQMSEF